VQLNLFDSILGKKKPGGGGECCRIENAKVERGEGGVLWETKKKDSGSGASPTEIKKRRLTTLARGWKK